MSLDFGPFSTLMGNWDSSILLCHIAGWILEFAQVQNGERLLSNLIKLIEVFCS